MANKLGFGSKIGSITNRITAMTSLMSNYSEEDEEYKILKYRTQCGQAQQQSEIDKAKGILTTPMPKSWYILAENKILDTDSESEIKRKKLYERICAYKKPYFFAYNYTSLKKEFDDYMLKVNEKSYLMFGKGYKDLDDTNPRHLKFIDSVERNLPLDISPSVMNKICWGVEKVFSDFKGTLDNVYFNREILKSGGKYSLTSYKEIENIYKLYKKKIDECAKRINSEYYIDTEPQGYDQIREWFKEECEKTVPNAIELCDILVDICYRGKNNKEPVWFVSGDIIIANLLKKNNMNLFFPRSIEDEAEFSCCGKTFKMCKIKMGGEQDA